MVGIWFPSMYIPELALPAVKLADFWILGNHIIIGWDRTVILSRTKILDGFKLFDTDDITKPVIGVVDAIPQAVWNLCKNTLDSWAEEYYARHSEEGE